MSAIWPTQLMGPRKSRSSDWIRIAIASRRTRYHVVTLPTSYKRVETSPGNVRDRDLRSGSLRLIRFVAPSKAKAYNYYNGESARGCIRFVVRPKYRLRDRTFVRGSLRPPRFHRRMITVRASKKEALRGPPAAFHVREKRSHSRNCDRSKEIHRRVYIHM